MKDEELVYTLEMMALSKNILEHSRPMTSEEYTAMSDFFYQEFEEDMEKLKIKYND